jgi:hypothetical protein
VDLPSEHLEHSVSQLLDQVFPADAEKRQDISARFDLRANPDLPDIYAVLLAVCEEWRDWRCALLASAAAESVELDETVSRLLRSEGDTRSVSLRLEQRYSPLEHVVRHGLWASRGELLGWMRSLVALYFIDKHEAVIEAPVSGKAGPALARAMPDLEAQGIIGPQSRGDEDDRNVPEGGGRVYAITSEGRRFISRLLAETESYIDAYDHYQDTLADPDGELVDFGTGRGLDLRVEVFLAEGLDPIRTVFLLRLYDGTLDARLRDWTDAIETEELFEGLLEPVVNRDSLSADAMQEVLDLGHAWLEEQRELARRAEQDRDLLRRASGGAP